MTAIVAARLKDKVIIGADSQINFGNTKLFSHSYSKLVEVKPNLIIGFSGLNAIRHILRDFKKQKGIKVPTSIDECYDLTRPIFKAYSDIVKESLSFELDKEELVTVNLLIATDQHIFIADDLSAEEFDYAAIGSGEDHSLAVLQACYPKANCVQKALLSACKYSNSCSEPIEIMEIPRKR